MRLKPFSGFSLKLIAALLIAIVFPMTTGAARPQASDDAHGPPQGVGQRGPHDRESGPEDEQREQMEKDLAKKANQERQAQLKRDTDKLLQLATDLKTEVDKSNENILAVDVVKKADEIEKLAHSVKEKMKGSS